MAPQSIQFKWNYLYLPCCLIWHIEVSDFLTISLVQVHEDCFCCSGCSPSCVTSGPSCVTSGGSGFLAVTGTGKACSFFKDSRGPVSTMSFSLKVGKSHKVFFSIWPHPQNEEQKHYMAPSIKYVVSKSAIFNTFPLLVVFLLSKSGNFWPPPLPP